MTLQYYIKPMKYTIFLIVVLWQQLRRYVFHAHQKIMMCFMASSLKFPRNRVSLCVHEKKCEGGGRIVSVHNHWKNHMNSHASHHKRQHQYNKGNA